MKYNILKDLRKKFNYTQKDVAEKLNMNFRTYCSYDNNEHEPNHKTLVAIANLFDVSVDYLLGNDNTSSLSNINADVSKNFVIPDSLTENEKIFLKGYFSLPDDDREKLVVILKNIFNNT